MFVDSHAHLDDPAFSDDLPEVLERAALAQVESVLTIGCVKADPAAIPAVLGIVERHPRVFASFGVHPHDSDSYTSDLGEEIVRTMSHPKVVAWGEIGLDYHYNLSPPDRQRAVFLEQLRLARSAGKPVIIHTREAERDTLDILAGLAGSHPPGVFHCFSSSPELARRVLAMGFCIAFGGILTFPKADELRRIASEVPDDRLLIETDCPYLAPVPHRGRRNEPAWVVRVAETLAEARGTIAPSIGALTTANFHALFLPEGRGGFELSGRHEL
jgi:TatD DNase family protein